MSFFTFANGCVPLLDDDCRNRYTRTPCGVHRTRMGCQHNWAYRSSFIFVEMGNVIIVKMAKMCYSQQDSNRFLSEWYVFVLISCKWILDGLTRSKEQRLAVYTDLTLNRYEMILKAFQPIIINIYLLL